MYDIRNSSYLTKDITENYSVYYEHGGRKQVETSGVYFGSLKMFILSAKLENILIGTSLNI